MFTGLVESTGRIKELQPTAGALRLIVEAPGLAGRWKTGDSIAVNGVCLTALPSNEGGADGQAEFAADLAQETIERTSLQQLLPDGLVNLELPTPAGSPLGGHVVQGHVDGTATVVSFTALHPETPTETDWRLALTLPEQLAVQVIPQGSVTVDGISLTVAKVQGQQIEIAIIPHTWAATNLRSLRPGDKVNIETDVLAKYAARQAKQSQEPNEWLTGSYLLANGY